MKKNTTLKDLLCKPIPMLHPSSRQSLIFMLSLLSLSFLTAQVPEDGLFRPILGQERVLFIRVNYPDDSTAALTDDRAQPHADAVEAVMEANSYGKHTFDIDITPILTMPQPKAFYELDDRVSFVRLRSDALKIAEEAGFSIEDYDREAIFTVKVWPQPYSGTGGINSRTIYTKRDNIAHTCHEFGHTFDWKHANFWQVTSSSNPLDINGTIIEYGDKFDIMGDFLNPHHFNPWYKWRAGWLPPESVHTVTASGNYIIRGLELTPLTGPANAYTALRIRREPRLEFMVYYRSQEPNANEGAMISLVAPTNISHALLLDMHPGSLMPSNDFMDAALLPGETLHDNLSGVEITLLQKNSDSILVNVVVPPGPMDVLPKINFISPELGLTIQGAVDYEVTAYDPDIGIFNGAGIDTIKYALGYVIGDNPYIEDGTEFIKVATGISTTPPYVFHVETSGLPDECYRLVVDAFSQNGAQSRSVFNHIIDNTGPSMTSTVENMGALPNAVQLEQNIPNPFHQSTIINYQLNQPGKVTLSIYDFLGRPVRTWYQGHQSTGRHSVRWEGDNSAGKALSSGLYVYELRLGEMVVKKKMMLFR